MLPSELESSDLTTAELLPQLLFGVGQVTAETPCASGDRFGAGKA
jgi:hypothetical protein